MKYLLIILSFCSYFLIYSEANSKSITIENTIIKNIDAKHYKTSSFNRIGEYEKYFYSPTINMQMTSFFKKIGVQTFRLHSPVYQHTNAKFNLWNSLAYYGNSPLKSIVDDLDFIKWASNNGFKVIIQLNTSNYFDINKNKIILANDEPDITTKMAESNANFFSLLKKNNLLSTILYVEFGNEDYIGMTTYPGTNPKVYAKIVKETIDRLNRLDATIKYCVVGQSVDFNLRVPQNKGNWTVSEWVKTVLFELNKMGINDSITYVAHHAYADDRSTGEKLSPGSRSSEYDIPNFNNDWNYYKLYKTSETGSIHALREYLSNNGFNKTTIEVNEFRRGGYNSYYNRSYMNLLANLDPWIAFINDEKVSGSLLWESFNNSDLFTKEKPWKGPMGYGVILRTSNSFELSMPGYIYKIMDLMLNDQASVLKTNDPFSCALIDGTKLKFLFYSKSSEPVKLDIVLRGFKTSINNLTQEVMYPEAITDFIINPSTGKTNSIKEEVIKLNPNVKSFNIRPYSINVFTYELAI